MATYQASPAMWPASKLSSGKFTESSCATVFWNIFLYYPSGFVLYCRHDRRSCTIINHIMKTITGTLLATLITFSLQVDAATLSLQIVDSSNLPAVDVVAYAEPMFEQPSNKPIRPAQIEQRGRKFVPTVSVVQIGSAVSFPNNDTVRHQVYSFSPAKVFELKLYSGAGGTPIVFDKAGIVVIGCNIHDQMTAFVQVVDTPYFGKSDASGKITIENMPVGKYHLKVWHPVMALAPAISMKDLSITAADNTMSFAVPFKTERK